MRDTWKVLIVVVLVIAVAAILVGRRNGANTAPTPPSPTSRETAAQSPAPAPQTPATGAKPKRTQTPKGNALPQMIELGSKTCIPCQMMQPILEELRKKYKGQLEVPFWDVYEHPDKAKAYGIRIIPTQVFIGADGKEFFRHEGFFPKEDVLAKFQEHGIALRATK
jgi:thioredoxin 1